MATKIVCENCGGEVDAHIDKCPFCGYINLKAAEEKHERKLSEIEQEINIVRKEPQRAYRHSAKKGFLIALVVFLLLVAIWISTEYYVKNHTAPIEVDGKSAVSELVYQESIYPILDQAVTEKDIETLERIYHEAEQQKHSLYRYDHYELVFAAHCYSELVNDYLPKLESGKMGIFDTGEFTYYAFYFYYEVYGEEGIDWYAPFRDEIAECLFEEMHYTKEELAKLRSKAISGTNAYRANCEWIGYRKYIKNLFY